ncbi:MAG: hypothetical protein ACLR1T_17460 [Evtepia gabavorous]
MKDTYESPLASRYASREMLYIFSPDKNSPPGAGCGLPWPGRRRSWACPSPRGRSTSWSGRRTTSTMTWPRRRSGSSAMT